MQECKKGMAQLTEYFSFNGRKVDQMDPFDLLGTVFKKILMTINSDLDTFFN
jgi:hypothetical protein